MQGSNGPKIVALATNRTKGEETATREMGASLLTLRALRISMPAREPPGRLSTSTQEPTEAAGAGGIEAMGERGGGAEEGWCREP